MCVYVYIVNVMCVRDSIVIICVKDIGKEG